jgi:hypothetical protein
MDNRIPSFKDLEEEPIVPRLPVGWKVLSPDKVVSPRGNPFSIKLDTTGNIQSYSSDKVTPSFSFTQPTGGLKPIKPLPTLSREEQTEVRAIQTGTTVPPSMKIPTSMAEESEKFQQAKRTITPEQAIAKLQEIETAPKETFGTTFRRELSTPEQFIPFLGSAADYFKLSTANKAAQAIMSGQPVSEQELNQLYNFIYKSSVDKTFGSKVMEVLAQIPAFAGEIAATGGIASGVKSGGMSALRRIIGSAVEGKLTNLFARGVTGLIGAGVAAIPAAGVRTPTGTIERQLVNTLTGDEESVWESAIKAFGSAWVEATSERTGGVINTLAAPIKGQLLKIGLINSIKKLNPLRSSAEISKFFGTFGYNGVLGEMFEERVSELGNAALGIQPFQLPSGEQLLTELVSFSIPGLANVAISTGMSAIDMANQIQPMPSIDDTTEGTNVPEKVTKDITPQLIKDRFSVDEKLEMRSPYSGDIVEVSFRGDSGSGNAVVWTGTSQFEVPVKWLSRSREGQLAILRKQFDEAEQEGSYLEGLVKAGRELPPEVVANLKKQSDIVDKIKELEKPKRALELQQKEESKKAFLDAETKAIENAPVYQRSNGWEVIKRAVDYVLRDPYTKEEIYRGKLSRVREVALESKPTPPITKTTPRTEQPLSPNEQPKANITPEINSQLKTLGYTEDIIKDLDQAEVNSIIKNQTKWQFGEARVPSVQGALESSTTATPAIKHGDFVNDFTEEQKAIYYKEYKRLTDNGVDRNSAIRFSREVARGVIPETTQPAVSKPIPQAPQSTTEPVSEEVSTIPYSTVPKGLTREQFQSYHQERVNAVISARKKLELTKKYGTKEQIKQAQNDVYDAEYQMGTSLLTGAYKKYLSVSQGITLEEVQGKITSQEITPKQPVSTVGETPKDIIKVGKDTFSIAEAEDMLSYFGDYLSNPNVTQEYGLFKKMVSLQKKERISNYEDIYNSLIDSGIDRTEADKVARSALKGAYKYEQTEMVNAVSENIIELMRGYIDYKFNVELQGKYPWERLSVIEALTNAASGKPIPSDRTKVTVGGSQLFPNGATALERLQFVFGGSMPQLIEGLKKSSSKKIPLGKFIEDGIFRDIPEGGFKPQQIDEEMAEYLRGLPEPPMPPFGQQGGQMFPEEYKPSDIKIDDKRTKAEKILDMKNLKGSENKELLTFNPTDKLGLEQQQQQFALGQEPYKPSDIKIQDTRTKAEKILDAQKLKEERELEWYDAPEIKRVVKQDPLMKDILTPKRYQALKDLGMGVLDILNGIRSIKASIDQSFALRQLLWIMPDIRQDMIDVMVTSWKSGWSETAAKDAWTEITKKSWYPLHEKMVEKGHVDAFRRGGIEEFGFVGESERPVSKAFAKLPTTQWSERNYVAGINAGIAHAYDRYYESIMRDSQLIAEGKKKAPKEGFSVERDFGAMMDVTADLTGRAKLGDLKPNSATYQAINALFFSMRNKLGRFLTPVHLLGFNKLGKGAYFSPRLLKNTWKNAAIMVGMIGSIIALGELAGWWDVEKDPNSADFGKIRIGKMRIDPWAGMQQVFVFFYRMASGKIKSTTTGETGQIDPADLISDTVEKSGSPALSLLLEARRGKTYSGEKLSATDTGQWIDRLAPFLVSDIYNTLEEYPGDIGKAVTSGALGYLGAGVNTYGTETQTQQFTSKLGTEDTEGLQAEVDRLTKSGATQSKINEVKEKGKTYDITSLRQDLDKIINTFDKEALDNDPLARYFKDWNTQNDSYKGMSSKEQERYLDSNFDFQVGKIFWGEESTISTIEQANALVDLANDYDIAPDMIPAFQLTDKGRERIPVNQDLWEDYFEYYDLPGSSYFAIEDEEVIQEYIDNGKLDAGMLKIWQQYQKSSENARKVYRKKYKLTMAKGDWREDYRRANPELDTWLIEKSNANGGKGMEPLPKKKVTSTTSRAVSQGTTLSSTPSMGSISRSRKASYPKFKKPRLSMSINAPRVRGV